MTPAGGKACGCFAIYNKEDIEKVCAIMKEFLEEYNHEED